MTQGFYKLNSHSPPKGHNLKLEGFSNFRRPVLSSLDDDELMAIESFKARLNLQSMYNLQANFQDKNSSENDYNQGDVRVPDPIVRIKEIIPVYSTMIPNLRTASADNVFDYHKAKYKEDKTYSNRRTSERNSIKIPFKNNISTFCDNSTMTRKLQDACCNVCCPPNECNVNRKLVKVAPIDRTSVNQKSNMRRTVDFYNNSKDDYYKEDRRKLTDYEKLLQNAAPSHFYTKNSKINSKVGDSCNPENTLDDNNFNGFITSARACRRKRLMSPKKISPRCDSPCIVKRVENNVIPYAHHTHSKYHSACRSPDYNPSYRLETDVRPLVPSRTLQNKLSKGYDWNENRPHIKFPRKVLTSVRNVDYFVETSREK